MRSIPFAVWLLAFSLFASARAAVVAHYPFDTNFSDAGPSAAGGTLVDVGTTGNSGITTNSGDWIFGGGALHLDADRDYVAVTSRTFGSGSPYSIAFWARRAPGDTGGAAQWDMVIGQRDNANFFIALNDGSPSGTLGMRWRSSDSTTKRQADFVSPNDTVWHHHVVTADNVSNICYYLDGALVATATNKLTGFIYDSIGEAYTNSSDFDFNGQLDEVWIFNETIGPAAVSNLYAGNSTNASAQLRLHYRFDGDLLDASGNTNDATLSGNAALTASLPAVPLGTGALRLDGLYTSHVTLASTIQFSSLSPWTIAFWAQQDAPVTNHGMVIGERGTTDDFIWLNVQFTGLRFRSSASPQQTIDFTAPKDTNLHHYALVASGSSNLTLYIDGVRSETKTNGTSFTIDTVGQAYNASLPYGFMGVLDDVRVYAGMLGDAEILALYNLRSPPPTSSVTRVRVVLVGGQSNADGRADPTALPTSPVNLQQPQADILFHYRAPAGGATTFTTLRPGTSGTSQFGPEVTCGRHYADLMVTDASTRVAVVKYARGGTALIDAWKPGGDATTAGDGPEYVFFQQTVTAGLANVAAAYPGATILLDGLVWMQGESDDSVASTYATNLAAFIADVRATFRTNLPFVIGRLSTGQTAIAATPLATLRQAQATVAAADPWTGLVDTDTYPVKVADHLHFDAAGQQALGYGFAHELAYLIWAPDRFTTEQIGSGDAEPDADADGDGARNAAEFIAGTDPTNSASVLSASLRSIGAGFFDVRYPGFAGRRYAVEVRTNLLADEWAMLLPPETGTNGLTIRPVTNAAPSSFYRVRATLP